MIHSFKKECRFLRDIRNLDFFLNTGVLIHQYIKKVREGGKVEGIDREADRSTEEQEANVRRERWRDR